ncbi:WD40 repeat domain-containing protein [Virgisporangium aurantiacum]|uniref:Anaphase-promoting complex subunit 4-like WD40 domain-containing protein n=1 Tax=Virgisporangium aurantiacum TaxID=175570 RepID=A0A8J3ZGI4_9ACTN|nr:hypothetical protein [Virgisporangium aurantiacum]GIJ63494.1 hypothetical protein Vau01_110100 [Virgisporangium aurantiacum]
MNAPECSQALCWSPDGTAVAAGGADTVRIWDIATGTVSRVLKGYRSAVYALAWSPDGARIASAGGSGRVRLVDAHTGKLDRSFTGHGTACWTIGWSPDGGRLAAGGRSGVLVLWDLATGRGPEIRVTYRSPGLRTWPGPRTVRGSRPATPRVRCTSGTPERERRSGPPPP